MKGWWRSLTGQGRENPGFEQAGRELYEECDIRSDARGGVRVEDQD